MTTTSDLLLPGRGNRTVRLLARVGPGPASRYAARIKAMVVPWREAGATLTEVADRLNREGFRTFRGHHWKVPRLCQILKI
jgi:hypothetical protein